MSPAKSFNDEYELDFDVTAGATLGLAGTASILGVAGTILTLTLRTKATTDQDGPCNNFLVHPQQQVPVPPIAIPQPSNATRGLPPPAYTEDTV